jgi:hypothetical protein
MAVPGWWRSTVVVLAGALALGLPACSNDKKAAAPPTSTTSAFAAALSSTTSATSSTSTPSSSTSAIATSATTTAPTRVRSLVGFQSPSKNIGCIAIEGDDYARCDIIERSWKPPRKPADCDLDWGHAFGVGPDGAGVVCAGDTVLNPDAPVLAYGEVSRVGNLECSSTTEGMRCTHRATGRGFFLSRARYELF